MPANYVVLILFAAAFVMSVVFHEVAHGYAARLCGDPTAEMAGRLSLNPIRHIDPFMTILLPVLLLVFSRGRMMFGGAKPVPVNPYNFRRLETDDLKVSLAGVTVNFTIAAFFGFSLHLWRPGQAGFTLFALITVVNLMLAFFNLLPIPPLDGSHVMRFVLARFSGELAAAYERIGRFGLLLLILFINFIPPVHIWAVDYVWFNVFMVRNIGWWEVVSNFRLSF
jgi:Zn-dependent protease